MAKDIVEHKKKSQKRKDRQARKAERRALKEKFEKHTERVEKMKPVRVRLSKKSLPGFLAKNVDAIIQFLKDYQLLYIAADDYGFPNIDRFPEIRMKCLHENYVQLVDFITILENVKKQAEQQDNDCQTCLSSCPQDYDVQSEEKENVELKLDVSLDDQLSSSY